MKLKEISKKLNTKTAKNIAVIGLLVLPTFALANAGYTANDATDKIVEIGKIIKNILAAVAGIWLTIMLITRGLKIMQGEMSARELVPPIAGGVVVFVAYAISTLILNGLNVGS